MKAPNGVRPLRLQIDAHAPVVRESPEQGFVGGRQRREDAQHHRVDRLAARDLDLRHAVADRQPTDQFTERQQHRRPARRQHMALAHLDDEAALLLVEADEHPPLLPDVAYRQPRPVAIAPRRTMNRRQDDLRPRGPDAFEVVFEHALLRCHLRAGVEVLHAAATAHAEVRAARRDTQAALALDVLGRRHFERSLGTGRTHARHFARQGPLDEDHLAVVVRDALAFVVERLDGDGADGAALVPHAASQAARNSGQCLPGNLPRLLRTSSHSRSCAARSSCPRSNWNRRYTRYVFTTSVSQ